MLTYHSGIGGEMEISFLFLMEGGLPFTYDAVNVAINTLRQGLAQRPDIDPHTMGVTIYQGGSAKIRCTISNQNGWQLALITTQSPLALRAYTWPNRKFNDEAAQAVFDEAKDEIMHSGQPTEIINEDLWVQVLGRSVRLRLTFDREYQRLPPVRWGEIHQLLDQIDDFLDQRGSYFELYGEIVWLAEQSQPRVGLFALAHRMDNVPLLMTNFTADTLPISQLSKS